MPNSRSRMLVSAGLPVAGWACDVAGSKGRIFLPVGPLTDRIRPSNKAGSDRDGPIPRRKACVAGPRGSRGASALPTT